jgi:hypothetical protein
MKPERTRISVFIAASVTSSPAMFQAMRLPAA